MNTNSNYELPNSDHINFDDDESSSDDDNEIAEFELHTIPSDVKKSKHSNKRSFLAKKKIEELQEERRLKKFEDDYYDDWD